MLLNKIKFNRNLWIYIVCTISTIILLFVVNWLIKLPFFVNLFGNDNTWIQIIANAVISGVIFVAGNWFSNADRLRRMIAERKMEFAQISTSITRVINSLNISRKQLSILYSIEIAMETPSLIKEILLIQQEIDEAKQEFEKTKYLIEDKNKLVEFEECISTISNAYHIVFDNMQRILNDWISTISVQTQAKTVADYIGGKNDKTDFALKYVESCNKLKNEKEKLIKVYEQQKNNVTIMFSEISKKGKDILDSEYKRIIILENKL